MWGPHLWDWLGDIWHGCTLMMYLIRTSLYIYNYIQLYTIIYNYIQLYIYIHIHMYICTYVHTYILYTNTGQEQLEGTDFARWWQCSRQTKCTSSGHGKRVWQRDIWYTLIVAKGFTGKKWTNDVDQWILMDFWWQSHVDSHMHMGLCEYKDGICRHD